MSFLVCPMWFSVVEINLMIYCTMKFWMVIFRWSSDGIKSVKHCVVVVTGGESL